MINFIYHAGKIVIPLMLILMFVAPIATLSIWNSIANIGRGAVEAIGWAIYHILLYSAVFMAGCKLMADYEKDRDEDV